MKNDKNRKVKRLTVRFTQSQWDWIIKKIQLSGENAGTIVRGCVNNEMSEE
jgi:hypothetical protein